MYGDKNYSDDLINEKVEPIIIKQEGGDKKFIYTIIILLVLLFLIALGVIAFLGSKYFDSNKNSSAPAQKQEATVEQPKFTQTDSAKKVAVIADPKKVEVAKTTKVESAPAKEEKPKANEEDTKGLEQLINSNEKQEKPAKQEVAPKVQQAVQAVASGATSKKLSKEEMATIAKMVAQELAKSQKASANSKGTSSSNKDTSLVKALESAPTDTLKEQKVDTSKISSGDAKAKTGSAKKVDTFNKVIVKQNTSGDDEFAKLTKEIDSILETKDVKQVESKDKFSKEIAKEAESRAKELRFIVVKKGDTLSTIARRAYGKSSAYKIIYRANPGLIKNPNRIYIGMKLRVPAINEGN